MNSELYLFLYILVDYLYEGWADNEEKVLWDYFSYLLSPACNCSGQPMR